MSWFEVESKSRITNYLILKSKIKQLGVFVKKTVKNDDYYALFPNNKVSNYPLKAFRVRYDKSDGSYTINFKKLLKKVSSKEVVVKEEYEFIISDKHGLNNFFSLIKDLGFSKWITKTKTSEVYEHRKFRGVHLELNRVKGLGDFLEVELLVNKKSEILGAKRKVLSVLKELGVIDDVNNTGYTKMLYSKKCRGNNG